MIRSIGLAVFTASFLYLSYKLAVAYKFYPPGVLYQPPSSCVKYELCDEYFDMIDSICANCK